MSKKTGPGILRHWQFLDVRGVAQLATHATLGVTGMVEGVHQSVLSTMGLPGGSEPGRARGLTGLVYKSVRGVTQVVGQGLEQSLSLLQTLLPPAAEKAETRERAALLAAVNGVMGDALAASASPFAIPMTLYCHGQAVMSMRADGQLPPAANEAPGAAPAPLWPAFTAPAGEVGGKLLLIIHGLCMNELQWQQRESAACQKPSGPATAQNSSEPATAKNPPDPASVNSSDPAALPRSDHGAVLAAQRGYTPLYLRYNSGLHVSQNGAQLAVMLKQVLAQWPVPVTELSVLVHSMGGLVIRSALHAASEQGMAWPQTLQNIVFLGTPHHGAPLERAGNWVDLLLAATPWSKPLAKLGHLRSSGITDLRYGMLLQQDWFGRDRFQRQPDLRQPLPLPEHIACYTVAAALAGRTGVLAERLLGDGLVPLRSALGQHDDPAQQLHFTGQAIFYNMDHMAMLYRPEITQQLLAWL